MSDNDHESRNWRLYIGDMIEFSEAVLSYTAGMDQTGFVADRRTYYATLHSLQLVGEAATHVPAEVRDTHSEVRWREIMGTETGLSTPTWVSTTTLSGTLSGPTYRNCWRNCVTFEARRVEW